MDKKPLVKVKYLDNVDFKYTNGAFGQVNANGDYVINFYFDQPGEAVSFPLSTDEFGNEFQKVETDLPVRVVHTQIICNTQVAKAIADWMHQNVEGFEKNKKGLKI